MKFLQNDKYVRFFSIAMCLIWCMSFFASYLSLKRKQNEYELLYAQLTSSSHYYNTVLKWANENEQNENLDEPLFNNASSAIITAWNNFKNASSFELFGDGKGVGTAGVNGMNYDVTMLMQNNIVKWADGTYYYEIQRYQTETIPFIGNPLTRTDAYYLPTGERWHRYTTNLLYDSKTKQIISNYTEDFKLSKNKTTFEYFNYIINEQTVVKETYFKVNRNIYTNKIESYSCSVILNNKTASVDFLKNLKEENKTMIVGDPVMTKLNINCVIDINGNFITFGVDECYKFKANYSGIIADVQTDSNLVYNFLKINQQPSLQKFW